MVTEPALPVVHGTTLTLKCSEDYTNKGGNTATCQNGKIVPSNQLPECKGEYDNKDFQYFNKSYLDLSFDDSLQRFKEHFDLCYFDLPILY